MAKYGSSGGNRNKINIDVGFNVDKTGLNDITKAIDQIYLTKDKDIIGTKSLDEARTRLREIEDTAGKVNDALTKAFNPRLDNINVSKFNQELQKSNLTLNDVYKDFSQAGSAGQQAFTKLAGSVMTSNVQLKNTETLMDKMGQTFVNTVKWNVASTVINGFQSAVQNAWNYVKVLDGSLNDIRIVTGQSREEMDKFATSANQAAQALGRQTKDYTNAYLTYTQQGLSPTQSAQRTQATLKASNITGQDTSTMANDLTAVWNGFDVSADNTEKIVSKLAAVADTSASNMSELATAMSKSASIANNMGVSVDQLAAQIATITQVTRQAPETTGNALKISA